MKLLGSWISPDLYSFSCSCICSRNSDLRSSVSLSTLSRGSRCLIDDTKKSRAGIPNSKSRLTLDIISLLSGSSGSYFLDATICHNMLMMGKLKVDEISTSFLCLELAIRSSMRHLISSCIMVSSFFLPNPKSFKCFKVNRLCSCQ